MELTTKADFQQCLDRAEAWWERTIIDRPPITISVRAGRPGERGSAPRPAGNRWIDEDVPAGAGGYRRRWMDVERAVASAAARIEGGTFFAETFPKYMPNLGPEVCATVYGAELVFSETTSWSVPLDGELADLTALSAELDTPYWKAIRQMTELSLQRGAGRWITAITDLHTNGDLVAALRDPQVLCLDFADDPAAAAAAVRHFTPDARLMYDDLYDRIAAAGQPCATWGPVISRGRMYYLSCDFICMISTRMFAEAILPAIEAEAGQLDRSIFHLDGPGALHHLDALLAVDALDAVQWTYGAGAGKASDWIDVYRRIQDADKAVEVHAADPDDARAVMEHLRPEGTWLCVRGGEYSPQEAQALAAETARWAAGKR